MTAAKPTPPKKKTAPRPTGARTAPPSPAGSFAVYDHTLQRFVSVPVPYDLATDQASRDTSGHELSVERV